MFGGSANIPNYDAPLQKAGGENNAFTSNDITNYYLYLPKENLETAFWLESDRMLALNFSDKSLEVQRSVVIEEFRQRYLNQPYGDDMLLLRPLAYKVHPYQWATIGKEIAHIEEATMQDVKDFFFAHYGPNNAVLAVAGDVKTEDVKALAEKWFGSIERRNVPVRNLPKEPKQTEARELTVHRDVPIDALYKAYHTCSRTHADYHATDLISDVLSNGRSSRLYRKLVQEQHLFSQLDAYIMGSIDDGLLLVAGNLMQGVDMATANAAIEQELAQLCEAPVNDYELTKVKNKAEANLVFNEMTNISKAMSLCLFELLGDVEMINQEVDKYLAVTAEQLQRVAQQILRPENCSTLYYHANAEAA